VMSLMRLVDVLFLSSCWMSVILVLMLWEGLVSVWCSVGFVFSMLMMVNSVFLMVVLLMLVVFRSELSCFWVMVSDLWLLFCIRSFVLL